jgi:dTDP-4-dehydrorhamnose 3,5-epimerase
MKVEKTKLDGVLLVKPEPFGGGKGEFSEDHRGFYVETYNEAEYKRQGIDVDFVQDDFSSSKKNVLRGLHGDTKTWKLVSCPLGEIYFVVVDCNTESSDFRKWESFNLSDKNHWQVLIPPLYGNGHLALTDKIIFQYKQSTYYKPGSQFSYRWDDPAFGIDWPVKNPILSERDSTSKYVKDR